MQHNFLANPNFCWRFHKPQWSKEAWFAYHLPLPNASFPATRTRSTREHEDEGTGANAETSSAPVRNSETPPHGAQAVGFTEIRAAIAIPIGMK